VWTTRSKAGSARGVDAGELGWRRGAHHDAAGAGDATHVLEGRRLVDDEQPGGWAGEGEGEGLDRGEGDEDGVGAVRGEEGRRTQGVGVGGVDEPGRGARGVGADAVRGEEGRGASHRGVGVGVGALRGEVGEGLREQPVDVGCRGAGW
jgi:hypothetical protein